MLASIKTTLKHSAIYSLGNIASKLIGIVLLPLYTKHITVAEYGILGILEITIMILTQVLILGQSQAYLRFHDLDENIQRKKSLLFTLFSFLFLLAIFINIVGQSVAPFLARFFFNPEEFEIYFRLCFVIIALQILNNLFLSVLRAKERSGLYATSNIIKIALTLGFNIYFVAFAGLGVRGILYSYLIGDGVLLLLLLLLAIREMIPKFDPHILKTAFVFGFPLIFTSLAGMLLNMGDRYILKLLVDYREVGLYNLGYKIAGILNVLFIQSFSLALLPIAYKMYGQKGDKRYYSKMLTYFVFVLCWAGLALTLFGREIVELLALSPDYWAAYQVVPYIVLGYIFSGARSVVNIGLYLKRKTSYIAYNAIGAAILNIGLNLLLIPKYKMMGAAIATVISFFTLYVVTYFTASRFYKVLYENEKVAGMLLISAALYLVSTIIPGISIFFVILIKLVILISFPFILYLFNFYEEIEIKTIKKGLAKIVNFGKAK